jgi:hypothetical protein
VLAEKMKIGKTMPRKDNTKAKKNRFQDFSRRAGGIANPTGSSKTTAQNVTAITTGFISSYGEHCIMRHA